jgi:hypothetical protein
MLDPFALSSSMVRKYSALAAVEVQIKKTTAPRMSTPPMTNLLMRMPTSDANSYKRIAKFTACLFYM